MHESSSADSGRRVRRHDRSTRTSLSKKQGLALALALIGALGLPGAAHAALVFFTSEAAFDAAAPGSTTQDAANTGANSVSAMSNPLDSSTNHGIFATGDIAPGLSISATGSNPGADLAIFGVGAFLANTDKLVVANSPNETLNQNFGPSVSAVGLDLLSLFATSTFTLSFFDAANASLGTITVPNVPNSGCGTLLRRRGDRG